MKIIAESSRDEMVLEWLKAELQSERFGIALQKAIKKAGKTRSIITQADLKNRADNDTRRCILRHYRSWMRLNLDHYTWCRAELSQHEVQLLRYIDYSYWNELSDHTRLVGQAVQNIRCGKIVFDVSNDGFYAVARHVEAGKALAPVILTVNGKDGFFELLEGHLRATGYALAKTTSLPLHAIIGYTIAV